MGQTDSVNFPTLNAFQPLLSESNHPAKVDAFVTGLNATGSGLSYSTYLGGSAPDTAEDIALDSANKPYVTGQTSGGTEWGTAVFPTTVPAAQSPPPKDWSPNAFVTKVDPQATGSASLAFSTHLGGAGIDSGSGIAVNSAGHAYVAGDTDSVSFTSPGSPQATSSCSNTCGATDAFIAKVTP